MNPDNGGDDRLAQDGKWLPWLPLTPLLFGVALFAVNESAVLAGYLSPPPGYTAAFLPQHMDYSQYQTWINAYQKTRGLLLPDYHAPWATEPALMNPYCWGVARISALLGVDSLWIYHLMSFALTIAGAYALFFTLRAFTYSRTQTRLALLLSLCCVPVPSVLALLRFIFGNSNRWIDLAARGSQVYSRFNGDGFVNGISGSPQVLFGTITTLLSMGLLARYLKTDSPKYIRWASVVSAVSAFIHPFEIFVIMGAGGLVLLLRRDRPWTQAAKDVAWLVVPGFVGMAPYLYLTARHAWLREAAVQNRWDALPPFALLLVLGFPALFCLFSSILPLAKRSVTDTLLLLWFGCTLMGVYVPWIPWSHHLLDGFHYATALLLVRQATRWGVIRRVWSQRPVLARASLGLFVVLSLSAHVLLVKDAIAAATVAGDPGSTVISKTDRAVLAWLRGHAASEDLVLAPKSSAGWFATAPMHSFASHWLFSLTWREQVRLSEAFYSGALDRRAADALLRDFGVRYVVIPDQSPAASYFSSQTPVARIETAAIYMLASPGLRPFVPFSRRMPAN